MRDSFYTLLKVQYHQKLLRRRTGFGQLIVSQIRFTGWQVWLWAAAMAAVMIPIFGYILSNPYITARRVGFCLSCLAVILSMSAVPSLYRSVRYGMLEVETAAYFSIKKLLLARLIVIFIGQAVWVVGILAAVSWHIDALNLAVSLSCVLFPMGIGWGGILWLVRKVPAEKICPGYVGYSLGLLLMLCVLFRYMPEVFEGMSNAVLIVGGCGFAAFCGYQGGMIVKGDVVRRF